MAFLKYALKTHPAAESIAREGLEAEELTDFVALKNLMQAASLKDQLRHMRAGTDREAMEVQELTTELEAQASKAAADAHAVEEAKKALQEDEQKAAACMQAAAADAHAVEEAKKALQAAERKAAASTQAAAAVEHAVEETTKAVEEAERNAAASMLAADSLYANLHRAVEQEGHTRRVIPAVREWATNAFATRPRHFPRPRPDGEQAPTAKQHRTERTNDTTEQLLACLGPHVQAQATPAQSRQRTRQALGYVDWNSPPAAVKPIAACPATPQLMRSSTEGSTAPRVPYTTKHLAGHHESSF
jgi:hypothetical protein